MRYKVPKPGEESDGKKPNIGIKRCVEAVRGGRGLVEGGF
jgi:hypothetical protein